MLSYTHTKELIDYFLDHLYQVLKEIKPLLNISLIDVQKYHLCWSAVCFTPN